MWLVILVPDGTTQSSNQCLTLLCRLVALHNRPLLMFDSTRFMDSVLVFLKKTSCRDYELFIYGAEDRIQDLTHTNHLLYH
jgi:hypothetical protein